MKEYIDQMIEVLQESVDDSMSNGVYEVLLLSLIDRLRQAHAAYETGSIDAQGVEVICQMTYMDYAKYSAANQIAIELEIQRRATCN